MAHSSFVDLADQIFRVLNVPTLTAPDPIGAGATGGVTDQPVVTTTQSFPFVWYELAAERSIGGLGPGPWLYEVDVRVHVFSQDRGMEEAQRITQEVTRLLRQVERGDSLNVTGWSTWYVPHDVNMTLPFELLNGVTVREVVIENRAYVEEAA